MELGLKAVADDDEAEAAGVNKSANAALRWLSGIRQNWLLIFDNADGDPDDVERYIPTSTGGNILFTSRNPNLSRFIPHEVANIEVVDMNETEATSLLLKWVAPEATSADVQASAESIVKELGCLPLAVDQAGAAIKSGLCTIDNYLKLYKFRRKDLMMHPSFRGASDYGRVSYTTWELSYRLIQEGALGGCSFITSDAADSALLIIDTFAFFHNHISEEIIKRAAECPDKLSWSEGIVLTGGGSAISSIVEEFLQRLVGRWMILDRAGKWDPFPFREGIRILKSFSLIRANTRAQVYSIHPLVHSWSRDRMSDEVRSGVCCSASAFLAHSIPPSRSATALAFRRDLVPHIKSCRAHKVEAFLSDCYSEHEFISFELAYHENGLWGEAEKLLVRLLELRQTVLGAEHPDTLTSMNNLASTYMNQGKHKEAEELQVRVLELKQTVLGTEHPDTLTTMNNLASTYMNQGKHKEAEELLVRVLELRQTVLGVEHPATLTTMNNLALTYQNQGRHKEAEELQVQVLELRQTVLGMEHPATLTTMNNLALTYRNQGRHKDAKELQVRVLELLQTVLLKLGQALLFTLRTFIYILLFPFMSDN